MDDVVLANLLHKRGEPPESLSRPAPPDVFLVNALPTSDPALQLTGQLRTARLAAATSFKATKNIANLLQEASASGARFALITGPLRIGPKSR